MLNVNLNVTGETVKVLAHIHKNSLYGQAALRSIQADPNIGLSAGEVRKAVTAGRKAGVFTVEDYTLERTYSRGKRTITESIPTKLVKVTAEGANLLSVLGLALSGDDKTLADWFRNELDQAIDLSNAELLKAA